MVRPEGFEPPTNRFEADYSIQLSYGRAGVQCSFHQAIRKPQFAAWEPSRIAFVQSRNSRLPPCRLRPAVCRPLRSFKPTDQPIDRYQNSEPEIQSQQRNEHQERHLEADYSFTQQENDRRNETGERATDACSNLQRPVLGHWGIRVRLRSHIGNVGRED
jgi:hypothetical protein